MGTAAGDPLARHPPGQRRQGRFHHPRLRVPVEGHAIPAAPACCAATSARSVRRAAASTRKSIMNPLRPCRLIGAICGTVQVGTSRRKVSVFVAVLCSSRLTFIEFTLSQRKAEFYRGLVNALTFFGGSPRTLIF